MNDNTPDLSTINPATITFAPDDPRTALATAVRIGGETIAAVRCEQLRLPTPCSDYDVEQLLGHMVFALHNLAVVGRGEDPLTVGYSAEATDGDWPSTWSAAAHDAQAAWAEPALLDQLHRFAFATLPGAVAMAIYASEVTVHTWDLARATGVMPAWNDSVVLLSLDAMRQGLPADGRGGEMPFDPVVPVAAEAAPIDQLVAWTGRQP